MRLIDADALINDILTDYGCDPKYIADETIDGLKPYTDQLILERIGLQPTVPASTWHRVDEPPEPHKKVLVSGMEAINNSRVYKVMVNDNGEWRPKDYAPSILWDYWMPIEPPKEDA